MERIFAIGDIHGCMDKLGTLIDQLDIEFERDTVVFIGDYIDRGPRSFEVVEYLINFKKRYQNTIFLKGNHEDMLEQYLSGVDRFAFLANGGQQTLDSYLDQDRTPKTFPIPDSHLDFFKSLVLFFETDQYIFVHAGLKKRSPSTFRTPTIFSGYGANSSTRIMIFGKQVVFGHTPFQEPLVLPNKIGIDTGAVYGKKLTCIKLPEIEFYQV